MQATTALSLSSLVQEHLTTLVREASCIQRHHKRARYHETAGDGGDGILRKRLHADDINLALQWRGSEKLYATGVVVPPGPGEDPTTKPIDLNAYLRSENQAPLPSEIGLSSHWLAVDGVQPNIAQNPAVASSSTNTFPLVHRVPEEENLAISENGQRPVSIRQLLPRLVSEELQLYFSRVTIAVERGGSTANTRQQQDAALASMARDVGLQELVPFFCRYISSQIYQHMNNVEHCRTLIRLTRSLLLNPHLHLELQLHQLLPALITCVVAKNLSSRPMDNHWALRFEAAQVLLLACDRFGQEYLTLQARVLKTLCEATAADKPLPTMFGGIVGVTLFGPKAVDAFLLPLVIPYFTKWQHQLENTRNLEQRFALQECQQAILDALGVFLQRVSPEEQAMRIHHDELEDAFGDALVMLESNPSNNYAMCIV
jgi:transcription initiation factor TFIID subunit 6